MPPVMPLWEKRGATWHRHGNLSHFALFEQNEGQEGRKQAVAVYFIDLPGAFQAVSVPVLAKHLFDTTMCHLPYTCSQVANTVAFPEA